MGNRQKIDQATRARFEQMYNGLEEKNARQKASIDRLLAMTMAAVSALEEIRDEGGEHIGTDQKIASDAIEKIEALRDADRSASSGNPEE